MIMNNFMAGGGSNMGPPDGAKSTQLDIVDLDALVDYVKSRPQPLQAPAENRIFIAR